MSGSILRYVITNSASSISSEPTEAFLQTVDNIVRPRLVRSTYTDGRTALLLAKAEDAQAASSDLSKATNVVVMGSQHMDTAPTFQHDKDQRNKTIDAYAQELLDVAKQIYSSYYHISAEQIPKEVTDSLLNYVSQVDIVEVADPGGSSFQPNFPSTVDNQIIPYKSFNSPQVEEAIKNLRSK